MTNCPPKPTCPGEGESVVPTAEAIVDDLAEVKTKTLAIIAGADAALGWVGANYLGTVGSVIGTVPTAVFLGAFAAAAATLGLIYVTYLHRCSSVDGVPACASGVVQAIIPSFQGTWDVVYPVGAMHPRVEVVVRCRYWPLVKTSGTSRIVCNGDADYSPVLAFYYYNSEVCAAGVGALIGGAIGAVGGILLACLVGAAIGCVTVALCALAVLIACLIAAVCVLAGACIGGNVARVATSTDMPENTDDVTLRPGDYITAKGNLITSGDVGGTNVLWFADPNNTVPHGISPNGRPDNGYRYSYLELEDAGSGLLSDGCGVVRVVGP